MIDWLILILAGFAAGALNAVAGGGTFLTFPALVHVGLPPIPANATSAVAVLPGYLSSCLGYREEIGRLSRARIAALVAVGLAGGLGGSLLLLVTPGRVFDQVVPWLLLFATLLFLAGDRITAAARRSLDAEDLKTPPEQAGASALLYPGLFLVSLYGGYFNGGLGIMLMALFAVSGFHDLNLANGLKNAVSFVVSLISVATFLIAGLVHLPQAAVMAVAATLGGYAGARVARRLPRAAIKAVIVTVGLVMSAVFFLR